MTDDEYRRRLVQMDDRGVMIEWVKQFSLARRFAREVEELGGSERLAGIGRSEARNLFRRYLDLDARWDVVDDVARGRLPS